MTSFYYTTTFFHQPDDRPKKPPYKGTLLPAVIEVFDLDIDLEELGVQKLQHVTTELEQQGNKMKADGNAACTALEPKFRKEIKKIESMQAHIRKIQAMIADAERQEQTKDQDALPDPEDADDTDDEPIAPKADEASDEETEAEMSRSERQARQLQREQARFKKASAKAKALHRKIMMLTHEERAGKNPQLRELFDLANVARSNNDVRALEGILKLAQSYNSKQGKLAVLNYLRQKRVALKNHANALRNAISQIQQSPPYCIHLLQAEGKIDEAELLFSNLLEAQVQVLRNAVVQAEGQLSSRTGKFSNGSTRMRMRF